MSDGVVTLLFCGVFIVVLSVLGTIQIKHDMETVQKDRDHKRIGRRGKPIG